MKEIMSYGNYNKDEPMKSIFSDNEKNNIQEKFSAIEDIDFWEKYFYGRNVFSWKDETLEEKNNKKEDIEDKPSIKVMNNRKEMLSYFEQKYKLLGRIVNIDKENNIFIIHASENTTGKTIEIKVAYNQVKEKEYPKITVGRRVILTYGKIYKSGTQFNSSTLYFRDEPNQSKREKEKIHKMVMELFEGLEEEDDLSC